MPQEHVKIDETLDERENGMFWKSENRASSTSLFLGPRDFIVSLESSIFIKIHRGSIHTRYVCSLQEKASGRCDSCFPHSWNGSGL